VTLRSAGLMLLMALLGDFGIESSVLAAAAYKTKIVGVEDSALAKELRDTSQLVNLETDKADNEATLSRRAEDDLDRLRAVTRAAGYYDADLGYDIDTHAEPWQVTVKIDPGEPYRLREVRLVSPEGGAPPLIDEFKPKEVGLELGAVGTSNAVVGAEPRIVRLYTERGWPLAKLAGREVVIDRADHSMHVTYTLEAGSKANFGPTEISGLQAVDRRFVEDQITWAQGEPYDSRKVEAVRQAITASNLFSTVKLAPADAVGPDGRVAMRLDLAERPSRSIGVGLYYDTSLGIGTRAYWEHRNFFGAGELLRAEINVGQSIYGGLLRLKKPDLFGNRDLGLNSELSLGQENVTAYDRRLARAFAGVDYRYDPMITVGAGVEADQSHVTDDVRTQNYALIGLPIYAKRDASNDLLNPTRGNREGITVAPFTSVSGGSFTFARGKLSASGYQKIGPTDRFVLAAYGNIGSTVGVSLSQLPRDQRLYAGGGGSVRGYGFQMAGPLDFQGKPIGGLSSLETGIELRTRITDTIGLANFVEGGTVYPRALPQLDKRLFWGTGIGVRYYSPLGPVRFDIATPLHRRRQDGLVQIYISLGQAF
jgi:translocation and assembly module TamA